MIKDTREILCSTNRFTFHTPEKLEALLNTFPNLEIISKDNRYAIRGWSKDEADYPKICQHLKDLQSDIPDSEAIILTALFIKNQERLNARTYTVTAHDAIPMDAIAFGTCKARQILQDNDYTPIYPESEDE